MLADPAVWSYFGRRFHLEVERRGRLGAAASPSAEPHGAEGAPPPGEGQPVPMALQVGSRPGTDDYVALIDYDVRRLAP